MRVEDALLQDEGRLRPIPAESANRGMKSKSAEDACVAYAEATKVQTVEVPQAQ